MWLSCWTFVATLESLDTLDLPPQHKWFLWIVFNWFWMLWMFSSWKYMKVPRTTKGRLLQWLFEWANADIDIWSNLCVDVGLKSKHQKYILFQYVWIFRNTFEVATWTTWPAPLGHGARNRGPWHPEVGLEHSQGHAGGSHRSHREGGMIQNESKWYKGDRYGDRHARFSSLDPEMSEISEASEISEIYIPSTTKCLRSPLGINPRVLEWGSRAILDSRPLTLPHCRPLEVLIPGIVFLCCNLLLPPTSDIYGSCGRYLEAWCPLFWELSKVPGILVIGKCTIFGVGFLRVFMALCGYLRHF